MHGALLDAEILADVYLFMTGGQTALLLDDQDTGNSTVRTLGSPEKRPKLTIVYADEEEAAAHEDWLKMLDEKSGGRCLWRTVDSQG